MSRLTRILAFIEGRPELVIEVILAVTLLVFAVYLGGPWYVAGPTTVIGNSIEADLTRALTAAIYLFPSIAVLGWIKNDRIRRRGTFGLFIAYLFTTILRLLTFGFTPFLWVFTLALASVAGVVYIVDFRRSG